MRPKRPPTPGELLVLIRRYHSGPGCGSWPTIPELARFCGQPPDVIQRVVAILVDRRLAAMDGEQVMPAEAKPSPLIVRQMTEEERARYGPPSPRIDQAEPRPMDPAPEETQQLQEVHDDMPTGERIAWPGDEEFLAEVEAAKVEYGENWMMVLARKYRCSGLTIRSKFSRVKERVTRKTERSATAEPSSVTDTDDLVATQEPQEKGQEEESLLPPLPIVEDRTLEERDADGDCQESHAQTGIPSEITVKVGVEDAPALAAALERAVMEQTAAASRLATHATLILVDESTKFPAQVTVAHEHLTLAPEQVGDEWGQAVRVEGRRTIRIWTCVGRVEVAGAPVCVMMPVGWEVYRVSRERGAA